MPDPAAPLATVCICTYNGAERIGLVLAALGTQTDRSDRWDVVVVDNASRDDTSAVVRQALAEHLPARGRLVREERPGLMHARRRATDVARGSVLVFLDDDNLPAPDYLATLLDLWPRHPRAGVMGGRVLPEWVGTPTMLGVAVADFALALCDRGDEPFAYRDVTGGPAGAGMIVKRELLLRIFTESDVASRVTGRTAAGVGGGEDTAIVIRAHQLGYEVRYEPALRVWHRLPADRTEPAYLLRLYEGIGRGQAAMRYLYDPKMRSPALALLIAAKEGLRWACAFVRGPAPALRRTFGDLAPEVHRLQRRQAYGRFLGGLRAARAR